jgi:carbon monoxide dehydrogenase subunit G
MSKVQGSYRSGAGAPGLWAALSDPERLGAALPDVREVEADGPDRFTAHVRPSTGLGATPMTLDVRIAERAEHERVRIVGDGAVGEHRVSFDVELTLRDDAAGDGGCEVAWSADVQAYGVLGSVTQRVLGMLLRDQVAIVLAEAERQAGAGAPAGAGA